MFFFCFVLFCFVFVFYNPFHFIFFVFVSRYLLIFHRIIMNSWGRMWLYVLLNLGETRFSGWGWFSIALYCRPLSLPTSRHHPNLSGYQLPVSEVCVMIQNKRKTGDHACPWGLSSLDKTAFTALHAHTRLLSLLSFFLSFLFYIFLQLFFFFFFIITIIIIIILLLWEFFTPALADGFPLEFEWQQVSSSLQDSSQYSGRPQQCCRLDSLHPPPISKSWEFFTPALADGFPLEYEWQQVSSSLLKSPRLFSVFWPI